MLTRILVMRGGVGVLVDSYVQAIGGDGGVPGVERWKGGRVEGWPLTARPGRACAIGRDAGHRYSLPPANAHGTTSAVSLGACSQSARRDHRAGLTIQP